MSGLTGSRGRCETTPNTLDSPTTRAAALIPPNASEYETKRRLSSVMILRLSVYSPFHSRVGPPPRALIRVASPASRCALAGRRRGRRRVLLVDAGEQSADTRRG